MVSNPKYSCCSSDLVLHQKNITAKMVVIKKNSFGYFLFIRKQMNPYDPNSNLTCNFFSCLVTQAFLIIICKLRGIHLFFL